jgi:hypothetical protein
MDRTLYNFRTAGEQIELNFSKELRDMTESFKMEFSEIQEVCYIAFHDSRNTANNSVENLFSLKLLHGLSDALKITKIVLLL